MFLSGKIAKKREIEQSNESMSNADRSISLHAANGSQNNEWKFAVHNAVKNDNISTNDLARKIRSKCGSKDLDGGISDKEFQAIRQCINRAERSLNNTKNFNLDLFKSLSPKDTNKILTRKQTFCLDRSTKVERIICKKQHEMEDDVMKHIDELWDKKKRVSRTLVFRCMCKNVS